MKKSYIMIMVVVLAVAAVAALGLGVMASELPFSNLFFASRTSEGYTSDERVVLTSDFSSSEQIAVSQGETVWFGPCVPSQYFQLVGMGADGSAATGKIRGKELTVFDEFSNGMVIYQYTVPSGVASLVFSIPTEVEQVFSVTKSELTELSWRAYWNQQGIDTDSFVGQSSYYGIVQGDKLYFGAITEADALESKLYDENGDMTGTIAKEDLRLVESFGGEFGIYCYTAPAGASYVRINYDPNYAQYYTCFLNPGDEDTIVERFITAFGVNRPLDSTVAALSGKTALFLGDSITYGAGDTANIYGAGAWAGRIGYYTGMDVTNNGVSGACISTARLESNSEAHYIYNNLVKTAGTEYDYVIMHGLFNDASENVALGTMQGKRSFDPAKADVSTFAGGLELLFYQARVQNPNAILGFIVNFHTERTNVDQLPYVNMAIQICQDWGIEYLDLYNWPGFSVEFSDGLHPSSAGYDSMYTIVANWMAGLDGQADNTTPSANSSAKVMSYNVFWNTASVAGEPYGSITNRTEQVIDLIQEQDADILLLQEVSPSWVQALKTELTGYTGYGYCHKCKTYNYDSTDSSGHSHEIAPILWKTDKYDALEQGSFWTEDLGIVSEYPRCVNWVVLQDKATGEKLVAISYHADPNVETARNQVAQAIVNELSELRGKYGNAAAVVGGDWNMASGSFAYNMVVGNGMLDARYVAADTESIGTYNAWDRVDASKYTLGDYVFLTAGMSADSFDVVSDDWANEEKTLHISDHCPIVVQITY